ncbi:24605_t:CDS:2 [Dentiscutata erythropus]|uniref:24605_t:CDS:1 n=1 Tax=Dentiscutata erythropus TaxID=1348616 RepID=A0A9N9HCI3_9GLOM|nr:24605_t:CDS:2 [Dentiscutata erythropus]
MITNNPQDLPQDLSFTVVRDISRINQWNSMDWFRQNIVQVFNTVSCNGTLFGKLLTHYLEPTNWSQEENQELEKILRRKLRENLKLFFIIPKSIPKTAILPARVPKYILESTIIDSKRAALIASWIDRKEDPEYYLPKENPYYFKLLLRGSRDGFFVEDFRKRCFNQGATVILIQTEIQSTATPSATTSSFNGQTRTGQIVMGGYNPKSWSGTNKFSSSTESFIFSLCSDSQSQITTLSRVVAHHFAISDDDSQFIGFGNGDLYIFKNSCQKRDYMYAILDRTKFSMDEIESVEVPLFFRKIRYIKYICILEEVCVYATSVLMF